jgi:hypothetical protein
MLLLTSGISSTDVKLLLISQICSSVIRFLMLMDSRVVESSTFTESSGTNPQVTVTMMGRYAYMNQIL